MRNKIMQFKNAELYKKVLEKKTDQYIVWAAQMSNSNTNNILVPRTKSLLHANTNTEEGLLCYHKSLPQLKETQQDQGYNIQEKLITVT